MGDLIGAIGLMSGTSMDGIDVAFIETDGEGAVKRIAAAGYAYDADLRSAVVSAIADARDLTRCDERPGLLGQVERRLTERNVEAVEAFLTQENIRPENVAAVGYHGQTVLHRPEAGLTVQLGDGPLLAQLTGLRVVYDLRAADMAAGGQGAPLVPVYHRALAGSLPERPIVLLNIGGVANVTFIGRDGELIAFDTGPGGALIDDWVARSSGGAQSYDKGGGLAAVGQVDEVLVAGFLKHDYFAASPPKSLDRDAFSAGLVEGLNPDDGAATLTAISAAAIARGLEHLPERPAKIIVCGGGRHNVTLSTQIARRTGIPVETAERAGFDGDSVEAEAWAYLAVRSLRGLPITFPGTTGVAAPLTGGVIAMAHNT